VHLINQSIIPFKIDLRRAAVLRNELSIHLSLRAAGGRPAQEDEAKASFITTAPGYVWSDYQIMMWPPKTVPQYRALRAIGLSGGSVISPKPGQDDQASTDQINRLLDADLRWFVENIATDYYAAYHRWQPGQEVNSAFLEAKQRLAADPSGHEPFLRQPSFSDPTWHQAIRNRLVQVAQRYSAYKPFYYTLGDETGIADLAAYWDFDFSPLALSELRLWLRQRYGNIAALNYQWQTAFADWDSVVPLTVLQAIKRADDNFSAWADFREWMDISFAQALKMGADAIHSVDPSAIVAIEGGQAPGWGGYDYALLAKALDGFELYDSGQNVDIVQSLNPAAVILTTAFNTGANEKLRVWRELLHGGRGLILWEDVVPYAGAGDYLTSRATETAPYYTEIRNGLGALLINSTRIQSPIAVHYSQASMRADWITTIKAAGQAGIDAATASDHPEDNFTKLRKAYCRLLADMNYQPGFISADQVAHGVLASKGIRTLILPDSSALSEAETAAVRTFVTRGGIVVADGQPGIFDEHVRRRNQASLADLFPAFSVVSPRVLSRGAGSAVQLDAAGVIDQRADILAALIGVFYAHGIQPTVTVADPSGAKVHDIDVSLWHNGPVILIGIIQTAGTSSNKGDRQEAGPRRLRVTLPQGGIVYDVRKGTALGWQKQLTIALPADEPVLLALSPQSLPEITVSAPVRASLGVTASVNINTTGQPLAATQVFHVNVFDPGGRLVSYYSGNVLSSDGHATFAVPLARNDVVGQWTVSVRDVLSGQERQAAVNVVPP